MFVFRGFPSHFTERRTSCAVCRGRKRAFPTSCDKHTASWRLAVRLSSMFAMPVLYWMHCPSISHLPLFTVYIVRRRLFAWRGNEGQPFSGDAEPAGDLEAGTADGGQDGTDAASPIGASAVRDRSANGRSGASPRPPHSPAGLRQPSSARSVAASPRATQARAGLPSALLVGGVHSGIFAWPYL